MTTANITVDQVFHEALQRAAGAERSAYLDAACANQPELRQRVERLLFAYGGADSFLELPAPGAVATPDLSSLEHPGTQIGPYKLLEQIGEGGMGVVYKAEQQEPVRRMVALKIIKPGMDTKEVVARFESERQTLALMDHPNIARVLDAGATAPSEGGYPGRPYFVMELVDGVPITEYCDQHNLATEERLALFITVCHAVQHAHQKGIIHRDIKPSNVLVSTHDGHPVPKVIDFGVAKATNHSFTERSLFTRHGQLIGTPDYMSPEQADLSGLDIDTRSDIYSLGVLLYELLTGSTPFDSHRLRDAGFRDMRQIIREEEPPNPSTRVSTLGEKLPVLTRERSTDVRKLVQLLRGDLDLIVMKALEKDRVRRYDTPNSFAADVERFLNHQPVEASPPSLIYRARKFARRNRAAVIAGTLVSASLLLALIATLCAFVISYQHAEERAQAAEENAKAASALTQETRRAALMQQLQHQRLSEHRAGWSSENWNLAKDAAQQKKTDDLRYEAAASLLGMDARMVKNLPFEATELAYHPSGKQLLMSKFFLDAQQDPTPSIQREVVQIWDSTSDEIRELPQQPHDAYGSITYRRDGTPLQLAWDKQEGSSIQVWDLSSQLVVYKLACPFGLQAAPSALSLTSGGEFAGVLIDEPGAADPKRKILVWNTESGQLLAAFPTAAGNIELSPDGNQVATSNENGIVEIWSVAQGVKFATLTSGHSAILCMSWAKDYLRKASAKETGWLLAVGSAGGDLTIWDVDARIARSYCRGSAFDVHQVAFSPDGMTLASVGRADLMLWDVATGQLVFRLGDHNEMLSLAFSPHGSSIAIGYFDFSTAQGGLDVWEIDEVRGQQVLRGLLAPVSQVRFSHNNRYVAALAQNWQLAVWDLQMHRLLRVLETPKGRFAQSAGLAIDNEGRRVAVAAGTEAKVWEVTTGCELNRIELPDGFLDNLVFKSTDELLLVRQESVDPQEPPVGPNRNPELSPRVCRVRNLLGHEPLKPLLEITDFKRSAVQVLATPDGKRVLIEGFYESGEDPERIIKLFELPAGNQRWELRSKFVRNNYRIELLDTTGDFLTMGDETFTPSILLLVDLDSGRQVRTMHIPIRGLGPGAKLNVADLPDTGAPRRVRRTLVSGDDDSPLLVLADTASITSGGLSLFSLDGNLVACGNVDGTVTVCDIPLVRRKLAEVGLGW